MTKAKKLYVPQNLPDIPADIRDESHYILHRIYVGRALWLSGQDEYQKPHLDRQPEYRTYTRLSSVLLQKVCGTRCYDALRWLTANNLIEKSPLNYSTKAHRCNAYRWRLPYTQCRRLGASPRISRLMERFSRRTFAEFHRTHKHLFEWLTKIKCDAKAATDFINDLTNEDETYHASDAEYRETVKMTLRLLVDGEYQATVCPYHRFHSTVTRLYSDLRAFLKIGGQYLVNVDIANSQPLILSLLLLDSLKSCPSTDLVSPDPLNPTSPSAFASQSQTQNALLDTVASLPPPTGSLYYHCGDSTPDPAIVCKREKLPNDAQKYLQLCESGQLYEHLMGACGEPPERRKQFKKSVYTYIFYGEADKYDSKVTKVFREEFPTVWRVICDYKFPQYKELAHEMQRRESRLMIDRVCNALMRRHPNVPVVTIHDSIMTTPDHVETVKAVILEEFNREGLTPTLKTNDYSDVRERYSPKRTVA